MHPIVTKRFPNFLSFLLLLVFFCGDLFGQALPVLQEPKGGLVPPAGISERPNVVSLPQNLPVYLSYHAGGNKPDEHAGPVGLGWSLHAGGCINRVVNGLKDEYSYDELLFYNQTHHYNDLCLNLQMTKELQL